MKRWVRTRGSKIIIYLNVVPKELLFFIYFINVVPRVTTFPEIEDPDIEDRDLKIDVIFYYFY